MKHRIKIILIAICALLAPQAADALDANKLADAIYRAEGGDKTRHPYGIVSVKPRNKAHAREICIRTIRNTHQRWIKAGRPGTFIAYLGAKYAPIGADNDPRGLNRLWVANVSRIYAARRAA